MHAVHSLPFHKSVYANHSLLLLQARITTLNFRNSKIIHAIRSPATDFIGTEFFYSVHKLSHVKALQLLAHGRAWQQKQDACQLKQHLTPATDSVSLLME